MSVDFHREDDAEKIAQARTNKNGKYLLVLLLVSVAAHWIFGRSSVTAWIYVASGILTGGCVFDWMGSQFQELRTRTKEINGKLTELKATLEELKRKM